LKVTLGVGVWVGVFDGVSVGVGVTVAVVVFINEVAEPPISSWGFPAYAYDVPSSTQNNVIYPSLDPSIFEVRYPNTDIKGKVVPL
jgi:hypothetical protein